MLTSFFISSIIKIGNEEIIIMTGIAVFNWYCDVMKIHSVKKRNKLFQKYLRDSKFQEKIWKKVVVTS